jgi:very-short-patch-repair endonuclease
MAPRARVPFELKLGPFSIREARAAGVSETALRSSSWRRVGRGLYCWARLPDDALELLCAFQRRYPQTTFAGRSAAWLHGLDVDPIRPIEIIVPCNSEIRSRPESTVHHMDLAPGDVTNIRALPATTFSRTFRDLRRGLSRLDALILADGALRLGLGRFDPLAEPSESPMETRLRWLLLQAHLPRPQVQANLTDEQGRFIARADLYYPEARLVIEYDGGNHRDRLVDDNRRQNLLVGAGYHVLRFTASDIYSRPDAVTAQVTGAAAASARRPAAAPR